MHNKDISVCAIVTTYNRKKYLTECLDSLLSQTRKIDDILVVDDGSSDGTEDHIAAYLDRVRYVRKENGGKSSAINYGLQHSTADYIWICDDDDYAAPDALENLVQGFLDNEDADFVFGNYELFKVNAAGDKTFSPLHHKPRSNEPNIKINLLEEMYALHFASLVKRAAYDEVGHFDIAMTRSEDWEMILRLSRHKKGVHLQKTIFYQRLHDGERGSGSTAFKASENRFKWMEYDQIIMGRVRDSYSLDEFTPSFALTYNNDLRKRTTLLERGLIFARRGLWHFAIEDFHSALAISSEVLSKDEIEICETIIRKAPPWLALAQQTETYQTLHAIYKSGETGRSMIMAMCRPLGWMTKFAVKSKDFKSAAIYIKLMTDILGFGGMLRRFLKSRR